MIWPRLKLTSHLKKLILVHWVKTDNWLIDGASSAGSVNPLIRRGRARVYVGR